LQLSPVLKQATLALAAGILIRLLLPVLPELGDVLRAIIEWLVNLEGPTWAFPDSLAAHVSAVSRTLLGTSIIFLYLFEILVLVLTLLPILSVEKKHREDKHEEELHTDPASQYDRVEKPTRG